MKLIQSKVERIDETDILKKIELAARTCYKSESNITDNSAYNMYNNLIKRNHTAMLEHAILHYDVSQHIRNDLVNQKYLEVDTVPYNHRGSRYHVSGNLRAILEIGYGPLIAALKVKYPNIAFETKFDDPEGCQLISEEALIKSCEGSSFPDNHISLTYRITCDRGVSHELVRHRTMSFAQESTRYVNYAKSEMQFIEPADYDKWSIYQKRAFESSLRSAEMNYNTLLSFEGVTPQIARALLPNAIKTEIVMTGTISKWKQFLELRYFEATGKVHPDMKRIATLIYLDLRSKYPQTF